MTLSATDLRAPELLQRLRHRLVETENQLRSHRNLGWRPDALRVINEDVGQLHSAANSMQPALARMIEPLMQSLHTATAAANMPSSVQTMQMLLQAGMR
ncbi:hypothetical protein [Thermomonas sp.]|uniref:hypothetical protein n=1 Tax=Thermomonas sp. TaxID=1971895 RepID=UPI0024882797|nr:hypothetical protein [Thermomonas sp.]MDI1252609.1 hypothetical protein [Thermomonas sp.]